METAQENKLMIPPSMASGLPSMVKNELAKLPVQRQEEFIEEYKRKKKSTGLAYLFLIIIFAAHYAYMGKWGMQVLFWLTGGGLFIWWIVDLFRLSGMISNMNKDIATDVMRNLRAISG